MNDAVSRPGTEGAAPDPVAIAILWDGYAAENYLDSVDGVGSRFAGTRAEVKRQVLLAVRWLLERDLVRLFSIDTRRAADDVKIPWDGTTDELIARLDAVYTNEVEDWHQWGYSCWFANTEAGDELARCYPPDRDA